jgi:hypothetical protein
LSWTNGNTPAVVLNNTNNSLTIASTAFNVGTTGNVSGVASMAFASGYTMYMDIVSVSNAELKTLYSAPKVLVAGVAGSVIDVVSVDIFYDATGTAFDTTANTIGCSYRTSGGTLTVASGTTTVAVLLCQTADTFVKILPVAVASSTMANIVGQNVVLNCLTADPTTGTGVVRVAISYRLVPTSF